MDCVFGKCIRFDDITTRETTKQSNKLAPKKQVFNIFVSNFQNYFKPSVYLTLNEQQVAFRGRMVWFSHVYKKQSGQIWYLTVCFGFG